MRRPASTELLDRLHTLQTYAAQYASDASVRALPEDAFAVRFWRTVADASELAHDVLHGADADEFDELARRLELSLEIRLECGAREIVARTALQVVLLTLRTELHSTRRLPHRE